MTDEKKYIDGITLKVTGVQVITNPYDEQEIQKVIFETAKGNISHKPKMKVSEFRNGIEFLTVKSCTVDKMHPKILEIGLEIKNKGGANVKMCYNTWKTEKDGEEVTYRFVQHASTLAKWELVTTEAVA